MQALGWFWGALALLQSVVNAENEMWNKANSDMAGMLAKATNVFVGYAKPPELSSQPLTWDSVFGLLGVIATAVGVEFPPAGAVLGIVFELGDVVSDVVEPNRAWTLIRLRRSMWTITMELPRRLKRGVTILAIISPWRKQAR